MARTNANLIQLMDLKALQTEDRIVMVPEFQRDYVWGSNEKIIADFLGDLYNGYLSAPDAKMEAPVKLTTFRRFKLTRSRRFKLTTPGRSKLTT